LADRNVLSHVLARAVLATNAHILVARLRQLRPHARAGLPDGTYLAELKPTRKAGGPPVTLLVIEC